MGVLVLVAVALALFEEGGGAWSRRSGSGWGSSHVAIEDKLQLLLAVVHACPDAHEVQI